jgi:hypothetical protein
VKTFPLCGVLFLVWVLLLTGCSNRIDPAVADREVRALLGDAPFFEWEVDPYSRLAAPSGNQFPLSPADDPDARKVTLRIQQEDAHEDGNQSIKLESGKWREKLPLLENGNILLDLETSMKLALLHSREFQAQKEELYLSALSVTYERFRLQPKPFFGVSGEVADIGEGSESALDSRIQTGFSGVAEQGATWVASLASRLSVELSEGTAELGGSLANLTITQPLLKGASKRIYRERLTLAERRLLNDARSMEQFRQGFFLGLATGSNPSRGPGQSGLASSSSQFSSSVSGYLGLLQDAQRIRNQEANVAKLRDSLAQLEAAFEAGRIGNRLQVDQARQALFGGQSGLLASKASFESRLDGFKQSMGLPPDLLVQVDEGYVEQFRLTDVQLVAMQEYLNRLLLFIRNPDETPAKEDLAIFGREALSMKKEVEESLAGFLADRAVLKVAIPSRKKWYAQLRGRSDLQELGMGAEAFGDDELDRVVSDLDATSVRLRDQFSAYWENLGELLSSIDTLTLDQVRGRLAESLNELTGMFLELSLARASARLESIVMEEVEVDARKAWKIASVERLDWMNARAALVDVWREADLARDDLRTDLDLVLSGDLGSDQLGSGHFQSSESRVRVGLELDSPLSKVYERNQYRAVLIQYQQARRQYLAFEDDVLRSLRNFNRLAKLNQLNFELSRAAVRGAISQVDLARLRLSEPPQPGRNAQFGATTARDLVNALNDLLDASNAFLQVWVGYEAMRMRLDYELGVMKLTEQGLWVDPKQTLVSDSDEKKDE